MPLDFSTTLTTLDGSPIERKDEKGVTLSWPAGQIAAAALLAPKQGITPEQLAQRGNLAYRLYEGGEHELTSEQISLVKEGAASSLVPAIAYPLIKFVDPAMVK